MIITQKHLPRRTFVKGMGVAIGLPMLDAMTPAFARAGAPGEVAGTPRLYVRAKWHSDEGLAAQSGR